METSGEELGDLLQRLRLCTEGSGIGTWERDLVTGAGRWNRTLWHINRRPYRDPPAPTRAEVAAMYHPDDREAVGRAWQRIIEGESDVAFEHRIVRGDGTTGWILSRGRVERDASGRPLRVFGNTIDVTDLHEARSRLDEARVRLELASEAAGIGIWERDLATGRGYWDEQLLALHGISHLRRTPQREEVRELVHPEDRDAWSRAFDAGPGSDAGTIDLPYRILAPDGSVRWLHARGRSIRDANSQVTKQIGVTFDVTSQRNAELAVQARELAERASAAKTEFLSRVSHELRTPLNAVTGFAQLLLLDPREQLSESQRGKVQQIDTAAWHLLALIDDVLDLARVESGRARIQASAVDLPALVHECVALCRRDAAERSIDVSVTVSDAGADGGPEAWCDRTRAKQVLVNLLSNAIKYNRGGGSVQVQIDCGADGLPRIRVADSGLGMSPDQLSHLFEPFNRLGREASGITGTGIGLALSKSLVEQMGARLEVDSAVGRGSVFELVLPVVPMAASEARAGHSTRPTPLDPLAQRSGRLLVVEDIAVNVEVLLRLLDMRPGLEIRVSGSGAAALELAAHWQPQVALLDLRLPDIDGIELAQRLRQQPGWQDTRFVCVSANVSPEAMSRAMQAGFADFWSKPLQATRVLQSLDRLLAPDAQLP